MKPSFYASVSLKNVLFLGIVILAGFNCKDDSKKSADSEETTKTEKPMEELQAARSTATTTRTSLVITNNTPDSLEVAIVLAAVGGGCPASNPPVTADQLDSLGFCSNVIESGNAPYAGKCTFTLAGNSSKTFPSLSNTCISGNVTFGGYPACPDTQFPKGYTTAEFTLNPTQGAEAIDISLVNGFNQQVDMTMKGGGSWAYGTNNTAISSIVPKPLGQNVGNPGVYPENCTDCIQLVGNSVCPTFSSTPTCQSSRICNAQRSFNQNGGTVTITAQP